MFSRVLACVLLLLSSGCRAEQQTAPAPSTPDLTQTADSALPVIPLEIRSGEKIHRFRVEVAKSPDEQARGLMFRQRLGPSEGMLFPFDPPRPTSFWMKNTLIPLDMLFIRADGTIAEIAENTVPLSLEPVAVSEPVAAVLELAGGRSAALGIRPGDRVTWR